MKRERMSFYDYNKLLGSTVVILIYREDIEKLL
jgi:hypothetical protein